MTKRFRTLPFLLTIPLGATVACGDDGDTSDGPEPATTTGPDDSTGTPPGTTDDGGSTTDPGGSTTDPGGSTTDPGGSTTDPGDTGSTDDTGGPVQLEIIGEWREEFAPGEGIDHVIVEDRWDQLAAFGDAIFHIEGYDNDMRWVIAVGDPANEFSADLYSKFNWTWDGMDLYYCTAVFDAATFEDAMATPNADDGDLATGCGGFPWSLLMPQM